MKNGKIMVDSFILIYLNEKNNEKKENLPKL